MNIYEDESPMPSEVYHRFFYALQWSRADAVRMLNLLTGDGRPQAVDRMHMTLAITADYAAPPTALIQAMRNAGDAVAAAPFVVTLDTLTCFETHAALRPSRKNAALSAFQRLLAGEMARHGVPLRPEWAFNPHVTLSYNSRGEARRKVSPIRLTVQDFVLIHSEYGLTRHHPLGRWRLAGEPGTDLFGHALVAAE